MQCLGILFEVSIKVIRETFSKFFVLKHSTKEAIRSSFGRAPYVLNLLLAKNRQMTCLGIQLTISKESEKTECLGKLFQVLIKFVRNAFPKLICSTKWSIEQLLSWCATYLTFHQLKFGKKAMQKSRLFQVLVKFGFPKLVVLKSFTKRTMSSSFRRTVYSSEKRQ